MNQLEKKKLEMAKKMLGTQEGDEDEKNAKLSKKEINFLETLEGQIQKKINQSVKNDDFIEAAILGWSTVEQVFLPRLINFITKNLKINIPSSVFQSKTAGPLIDLYFCLSHDDELYSLLKQGNEKRNKIIHKLYKEDNLEKINKLAKEWTRLTVVKTYDAFFERFDGRKRIPVLTLYPNGWNDCREQIIKNLNGKGLLS